MNLIPAFSRAPVDALAASMREAMALGAIRIWQYDDGRDHPRDDFEVTIKFKVGKSLVEAKGRQTTLVEALDEAVRAARALVGTSQ